MCAPGISFGSMLLHLNKLSFCVFSFILFIHCDIVGLTHLIFCENKSLHFCQVSTVE